MKVLQVHTRYRQAGGEDTVVQAERELLAAAGHQVLRHEAVNPAGPGAALSLASSPWNPAAARAVGKVVDGDRPDVAHVHNTWYAMSPSVPAALARRGIPVVATLHNYRRVCANASLFRDGRPCEDCVGRSPLPGVRHRCYRGSFAASAAAAAGIALNTRFDVLDRSVTLFLAVNDFARERFLRGGLAPGRVQLHPNFVEDPGPRPAPPSHSRTVVVVGRVEAAKGVGVLVEAWRRAAPRDLELVVLGEGDLRAELAALQVPGVRFTGALPREQVRRHLLGARALAFPSVLYEGQPMSVLEAMSCALPVLASRRGGTPSLLRDAPGSWLAEPGDVDSWESALRQLEADPGHIDEAGTALRRRWAQDHSAPVALERLLGIYESVRR